MPSGQGRFLVDACVGPKDGKICTPTPQWSGVNEHLLF